MQPIININMKTFCILGRFMNINSLNPHNKP